MKIQRECDWEEPLSDEWLLLHGFEKDNEDGAWCLWNGALPLFVHTTNEHGVWQAELDETPWPIDIRVCGQVRDLCRAIEYPLGQPCPKCDGTGMIRVDDGDAENGGGPAYDFFGPRCECGANGE